MTSEWPGNAHEDIGLCLVLTAQSLGPPGSRYFFIWVETDIARARIWLEKEQLNQLGLAIKNLLRTNSNENHGETTDQSNSEVQFECQLSRLALGQKEDAERYSIMIDGLGFQDQSVAIRLWADRKTFDEFADTAMGVCERGRPLCPLCNTPMGTGKKHVCSRSNGHVPL